MATLTLVKTFQVSLRRQEIADRLSAWTIFNDKKKEFCDWLTQMENKACHRGHLSMEEMVEKLKKVRQQAGNRTSSIQTLLLSIYVFCLITKACSCRKRQHSAPASQDHCFRLLVGMEELQPFNQVGLFCSFLCWSLLPQDCMEEINLFSENKSHLKQLGEQLLLASEAAKQTQVRGSLLEVNQRWHSLFHHIEAR